MIYWHLFWVFFRISCISFGGVFGSLPELQRDIVQHGWMDANQFMTTYIVGQFVPGPNMAMCPLIGYHVAGWGGWFAAFAGVYIPPLLITGLAFYLFSRYRHLVWVQRAEFAFRPMVFGLLLASTINMYLVQSAEHRLLAFIVIGGGALLTYTRLHDPLLIILLSGAAWVGLKAWI